MPPEEVNFENGNGNGNDGRPRQEGSALSYRGGFSTSIVDGLFEEHGHSDCCVLTCCGILLYDRNVFLLSGKRPSWRGRCGLATCFFVLVVIFLAAMAVAAYLYNYELEHIKELEADGKRPSQKDTTRIEQVKDLIQVASICRILVWVLAIYLLCKAAQYRYRARRFLVAKLYEERNPSDGTAEANETELSRATAATPLVATTTSDGLTAYLQNEKCNMCCATTPLGCISKDAMVVDPTAPLAEENTGRATDFCHFLWKTLACLCCGGCCHCWCQGFGLCAIAQEDRELQRMLPKAKFQVDYITFQPFEDFFPKLESLRQNKNNNMLAHFTELSQLSHHLCQSLLIALALMALLAFTKIDPLFQPAHLVVVVMTFVQAFVIIYLVHWMWNRFDLSFDAVVKYFASGFILCTANAFVYETFVSTSLTFGAGMIRALVDPPPMDDDDDHNWGADDGSNPQPIWLLVIMAFLNAFAVAGMVEEISKYFGYWMVEHPDLALPEANHAGRNAEASSENGATETTPQHRRTMKSLGAGITVAMVTTAVGFACCENFMYVFVYSRTNDAANQLITLVARSIFPVHPLAAAIQSIGVCQRDVEKDSTMKFGRILLPALLLHGFFDFALMFLDLWGRNNSGKTHSKSHHDGALDDPSFKGGSEVGVGQALPALISSVTIVLLAVVYYVVKALAQRRRLEEMDRRAQGNGEYTPLL